MNAEPQIIKMPSRDDQPANAGTIDVLDRVMMEWARAKIQRLDILNYNGANLANIHANDVAKKLGFNPQSIGVAPFPSPNVTSISMEQRTPAEPLPAKPANPNRSKCPTWLAVLLAMIVGAGLTCGGIALANHLKLSSPADTEYDVLFYDREGKLIDVPRVGPKNASPQPSPP